MPQHWPDEATILQKITYNENNDPLYLDGKQGDYAFEYGLGESRQTMHYGGNFDPALASEQAKFSKYYSEDGSYEVILDRTTGKEKHIMYIGGSPYESDIVLLKDFVDATAKYVFLHKDYLGTILAISDEQGQVIEQRHFDAWGILTHGEIKLIDRGYTSHEHLQDVGIIHMNGRLYDPLMRRFLNADENIQDPNNTQCYNKYGYAMNNPLMFNDPSGEILPLLVAAALIGAAVGTASYLVGITINIMNGGDARVSLSGILKSAFWGAVSGAVTFGIGSVFTSTANGIVTGASNLAKSLGNAAFLVKAAAHGIAQGLLSMVQNHGAGFLSGAAAGFFGDLGATAWSAGAGNFASSTVGTIAFGSLSGGVGAELTGGNFWQGAVTGGIVAGLNTLMHQQPDNKQPDNKQLAKRIADEYGYDWREVKAFLDENPFVPTHKGVAMGGIEALSSKNIEDGKTLVQYVGDQAQSEITSKIIEYLSPRAGKIWGLGNELLSTQSAHAPGSNYQAEQNQRIEACKSTLIQYYFQRPATYQTPSMFNNQQSAQYHSSRFDIMHFRYF